MRGSRVVSNVSVAMIAGCLLLVACSDDVIYPPPPPVRVDVSPTNSRVRVGTSQDFTANVSHDSHNVGVTWTLTGSGCTGSDCGTLSATTSASGAPITYSAPAAIPTPATVTLTAVSNADGKVSGVARITIAPPPILISLTGSSAVDIGGQQQITASVANDPSAAGVAWTLSGCSVAACGTLSATRSADGEVITYTAPAVVPNPNNVILTATSVTDPTVSVSFVMTITSSIQVAVSPGGFVGVDLNTSQQFTAGVTGDPSNLGVTWSLSGSSCPGGCGSLTPDGLYTPPSVIPTPATVSLTATSVTDYTKVAGVTVVITAPGVITVVVSPSATRIGFGGSRPFTAFVFHDPANAGVNWTASPGSVNPTNSASGGPVSYHATTLGTATVTATSVTDPTKSGGATVSVVPPRCRPAVCR